MFLLQDLPTHEIFERFKKHYPNLDECSTSLFLRIMRVGSDCLNILDEYLSDHDLTHGRWIALILLMREEKLHALPSTLAKKQGISRATMTRLLTKLESDGLVGKKPCKDDGRQTRVRLTAAGKRKLDAVMPGYYAMVKELFSSLDIDDKFQMIDSLDRIHSIFEERQLL